MRDDRLGRTGKMTRYQMTRGTLRNMPACDDEVQFEWGRDIQIGVQGLETQPYKLMYLLVCILAVLYCGNKKYPSGGFVNRSGVSTCTWTRSVKMTLSSLHTPGRHSAVSWISPTLGL